MMRRLVICLRRFCEQVLGSAASLTESVVEAGKKLRSRDNQGFSSVQIESLFLL